MLNVHELSFPNILLTTNYRQTSDKVCILLWGIWKEGPQGMFCPRPSERNHLETRGKDGASLGSTKTMLL
eukprot:3407144-Karenia_brevis.AAC.1